MTSTLAAVLHEPGDLRIGPIEVPRPGPGEVLIREIGRAHV